MTTKVTVDPANHKIEVIHHEGQASHSEVLEPMSGARDFWIHQGKSLTIGEVNAESQSAKDA